VEFFTPLHPEAAASLAMALVTSSHAPLLLLDGDLTIIGISASFCRAFQVGPLGVEATRLRELGTGEWNIPQLDALLIATANGNAAVDGYEMDLLRPAHPTRRLVVSAHRLEYFDDGTVRLVVSVVDVTEARLAEKLKDDLVREKQVLLQELQHRVANSLQIIASVLMQSARKVQSEETRLHLHDAHHRVMSIATLQRQLAENKQGDVALRAYLTDLCRSIGASMIHDPKLLTLTATVDDSITGSDVSISLGLIVTELVINALKHAFPGAGRAGAITVDYAAKGDGWTLAVGDNGVGMPGDHAEVKPGLGTSIVDAIAKQLGATVEVKGADPGTTVSIIHI
jgi:two-component sensor histidine kinase